MTDSWLARRLGPPPQQQTVRYQPGQPWPPLQQQPQYPQQQPQQQQIDVSRVHINNVGELLAYKDLWRGTPEEKQNTALCPKCGGPLQMYTGLNAPKIMNRDGVTCRPMERCHYCFAGGEKLITDNGIVAFEDVALTIQQVLNGEGKWVDAYIYEFEVQPLVEITFRPGLRRSGIRHRVRATPDHRWITVNRGSTQELQVGDDVRFVGAPLDGFSHDGWISGFGFGDGTITVRGQAQVGLHGEKVKYLEYFEDYGCCHIYDYSGRPGDKLVIFDRNHFYNWKRLPVNVRNAEWLASWFAGYYAADGEGDRGRLSTQNAAAAEFVMQIAPLAGRMVTGYNVESSTVTNFGERSAPLHRLTFQDSGVFRVMEIEELDIAEPVYCAVVEDGHEFVLANGIHTGNCGYNGHFEQLGQAATDSGIPLRVI